MAIQGNCILSNTLGLLLLQKLLIISYSYFQRVTFVQNVSHFWVKQESEVIKAQNGAVSVGATAFSASLIAVAALAFNLKFTY